MADHIKKTGGSHAGHQAPSARELRAREKERQRRQEAAARAAAQARKEAEQAERAELRRRKAARARVRRRRVWRTVKIVLIVVLAVTALAAAGLTYAGYRVTTSQTTLPGVSIHGIDVGGLTYEQTLDKLSASGWDKETAKELTVTLPGEQRFALKHLDAGVVQVKEEAAESAFAYGHSEDWFDNLYLYVRSWLYGAELGSAELTPDADYIRAQVKAGLKDFEKINVSAEPEVDRENKKLLLVKGPGDMKIDEDKLVAAVTEALEAGETALDYVRIDNELPMPDFDGLYKDLAVEPKDAHWIGDTFEVEPEIIGCKFDVDQAKKLWEAAPLMGEVSIPLAITEPEVTQADLEGMLYRDCLGSQTTLYTSSSDNRINNINLAASKINGLILMPGETFSYNGTIGQRTTEAGFLEAGAYTDGQVVQEVGGGICQVSSTLYCATLYAQLETVSRESHYFRVTYLDWGLDATVSWPKPDFKFTNSREYPIKIVATCNNEERSLTIEIWGTDVDGTHVEITYDRYIIFDSTYTDTVIGWNIYSFAHVYDADGNLLRTYELPASTYYMHDEDIQWPPEKFAPPPSADGGDENADIVP